jgi:hypothetical protein
MLFLVTGADKVSNTSLHRERYLEYMFSLHRIFSYTIPVIGVLSEYEPSSNSPPFSSFPFKILKTIPLGKLDGLGKSQKEFLSIFELLKEDIDISDDEFIIKISGRYMLVDDRFVNLVREHETNSRVNAIIRLSEDGTQQYTFLYAIRYRYFRKLHTERIIPGGVNTERYTLDFIKNNGLFDTTLRVDELGILTNIDNTNRHILF